MLAKTQPSKVRVLIIDDSRLVRIAASRMFGSEFDVVLAVDGADGWDVIRRDPDIQVVFTDLVMPEMDGFELLEAIRTSKNETISNLPVIVATGADNPEVAKQKAFALGATDFITKPFDATQLKARARSYAQFRQANKKLQEHTTIDMLTGLLNAKGLQRQLAKEISFVSRHRSTITVMSVEIDSFKDLFIRIGRAGAEAIIKKVSHVLVDAVRKEDTISRSGVASFVISMPLTQGDNALELADRICQNVESLRAKLEGKRIKITASVGICVIEPGITANVDTALAVSEEALARAGQLGRSQLYHMTMREYMKQEAENAKDTMSIDELLERIVYEEPSELMPLLDASLDRLSPLFGLLSNEQKQKILSYR